MWIKERNSRKFLTLFFVERIGWENISGGGWIWRVEAMGGELNLILEIMKDTHLCV